MIITYNNVGNVKQADIEIKEGYLNVKYGTNGTGKSTISKSLKLWKEDKKKFEKNYKPYTGTGVPTIFPDSSIDGEILLFDDEYIKSCLFNSTKKDISNNTFEIIRSNSKVKKLEEDLETLVSGLKEIFSNDALALEGFSKDVKEFTDGIKPGLTKKSFNKGDVTDHLFDKNAIELLPSTLKHKKYVDLDRKGSFIDWIKLGHDYQIDEYCPYCLQIINEEAKKEIEDFINSCNGDDVSKSKKAKDTLTKLNGYVKEENKNVIEEMLVQTSKASEEQVRFLDSILQKLAMELDKINKLKGKNISEYMEIIKNGSLESYRPDFDFFEDNTDNEALINAASDINLAIDRINKMSDSLKVEIDELTNELNKAVTNNKMFINDFLEFSGMPYRIDVIDYKTTLYPKNSSDVVSKPAEHLSYGERNSLSLLLFALEAINKNPALIIIDDPISSFDGNKKYAILHQLFADLGTVNNLRNKTVLMVTHDFEIVNDLVNLKKPEIKNLKASVLVNTGIKLEEKPIAKSDIIATQFVALEKAKDQTLPYIVRVLNARRNYEIRGFSKDYKLMASFIHNDNVPSDKDGNPLGYNTVLRSQDMFGEQFDYDLWLSSANKTAIQDYKNSKSNYDKLVLARFIIIRDAIPVDPRVWNFISSLYHIENDGIFSLKFEGYDLVPDYIVSMCTSILKTKYPTEF